MIWTIAGGIILGGIGLTVLALLVFVFLAAMAIDENRGDHLCVSCYLGIIALVAGLAVWRFGVPSF